MRMVEKIVLRGHRGVGGVAEGEAVVSMEPISYMMDIGSIWWSDKVMGTNKLSVPDLVGIELTGKVLVFPTSKGGIFSQEHIIDTHSRGIGPVAMVNRRTHPHFLIANIIAGVPTVDRLDKDPLEVIETGDWVKVDGQKGTVEVTKKNKVTGRGTSDREGKRS